jgi:hypothetical protein
VPSAGQFVLMKDRTATAAQFIVSPLNLGAVPATNAERASWQSLLFDDSVPKNSLDGFQNVAAISPIRQVDHNAAIHFTRDGAVR